MNKKITLFFVFAISASTFSFAQCGFSGLDPTYCMGDSSDTLVPDFAGGAFSGPGIVGNVFIPDSAGAGTHQIQHSITTDYVIDQTGTFAPAASPLVGATQVALTDDDVSGALPIGFSFNFYGNNYTDFYIGSNGFVTFSDLQPTGCCTGQVLPNTITPNNLIAFAWEDLDPGNGGQPAMNLVHYVTTGTAPNRILIVEFYNVDHWSSGNLVTSQVHMYETSNIIEIHTINMPSDGGSHTMGIENIDGTIAHPVPGRNSVSWTISNDYVAFIPLTCDSIVDVTVLTRPQVVGTANPDPACVGDNVTFTGSGADTYSWTNGVTDGVPFNVTASDDYIVTGTSVEGCVNWDTVSLIVNPNPTISLSPNDEMNGNDGSINLTILNGAAPFTFDWDNDGTGDNDDSNDLFNVGAGTYTVTMTDGNGCSVTDQATIGTQVGIVELDSDQFTIYPNPTEGIFSVSISEEIHASKAFLMVTDGLGRRIIDQQIDDQKTDVDISKEQNGIYYVKIINDNGVYVQKINLNK